MSVEDMTKAIEQLSRWYVNYPDYTIERINYNYITMSNGDVWYFNPHTKEIEDAD